MLLAHAATMQLQQQHVAAGGAGPAPLLAAPFASRAAAAAIASRQSSDESTFQELFDDAMVDAVLENDSLFTEVDSLYTQWVMDAGGCGGGC
jgi:hypothetical protein